MQGKLGDKILFTGSGGKEHLGFVTEEGDPATLVVFDENGASQATAPYRGKADGEKDGAGNTYRSIKDR